MRVESLVSTGTHLILRPPVVTAGKTVAHPSQKTLGEVPPIPLDLKEIGRLAALFGRGGLVSKLRRKLNYLKNKKCTVIPAKGTTACVDDNDVVYLGVEFLAEYGGDEATVAGVMAHEWGHACALKPNRSQVQKLNWNQIFELRRAHETLADETSGRLLYIMGYKPDGFVRFLTKGKEMHSLKYHSPEIRSQVVLYGYQVEKRKAGLARQLFRTSPYKTQYHSILLDIA